jgi:hypothetical protein
VTHQVGAAVEQRPELGGLLLEVDPLEQRPRRIAASVRRHELEPVREYLH